MTAQKGHLFTLSLCPGVSVGQNAGSIPDMGLLHIIQGIAIIHRLIAKNTSAIGDEILVSI